MTEDSIYKKCGGYEGITTVVDQVLERMAKDSLFDIFTKGYSKDSMKRRRQLLIEFICQAFGGPVTYIGRDMKTSHDGLGITDVHWDAIVNHMDATLDDNNIPQDLKNEIFDVISSVKDDIIQK